MSIETSSAGGVVPPLTLAWRLQMSLGHAGLTVQDMADDLGMARSSLSRWLNGHGAAPRKGFVKQWALRCGVSYDWLQNGESPRPDEDPNGGLRAPSGIRTPDPLVKGRRNEDAQVTPLRRFAEMPESIPA